MEILIENLTSNLIVDEEMIFSIKNSISKSLEHLNYGLDYEVSISIVDKEEIRSLNSQYRGKDSVTDVLSFPLYEREEIPMQGMLGDIVICSDRVLEQAKDFGHTYEREMIYLTVHSLLHLLGYDHETEEEKIEMRSKEKEIMNLLGIYK